MSTQSLLDLASDLINDAKLVSQSDKKLYKLEQVKEIIFHRDTSLIPHLLPGIFELMLDRSVAVRRFLVRLAGESLQITSDVVADVLALLSFLIVDGSEKLLESIADVLSRHYEKLSITIALMNPKVINVYQQSSSSQQVDPKDLWYQFRSMCTSLMEYISAQKSDNLRGQCLKLCEQIVLFSVQSSTSSSSLPDPRLRQSTGAKTVQEISMHHPFINRVELEKEAESMLAKLVLWARRGGSQQAPFSPMMQCRLAQTLALVATERPMTLKTILPALTFLLQGGQSKGNICEQMTAVARQQLSVGILRLLRVAPKLLSDQGPEHDQLQQLRKAVTLLEGGSSSQTPALPGNNVITLLSGVHSSDPRKRKLEQMAAAAALKSQQEADALKQETKNEVAIDEKSGTADSHNYGGYEEAADDSDNEMELDEESIRRNALSAVEARLASSGNNFTESGPSAKRSKIDDMLVNLTGSAGIPSATGATTVSTTSSSIAIDDFPVSSAHSGPQSNMTVLASDLGDFPKNSVGNSLRLVSLVSNGTISHLQSIPPPVEVYSDLSMVSLSTLIKQTISFSPQKSYKFSHASLLSSCLELKLVMRMVLSMSSRDLDQHRAYLEALASKSPGGGALLTRQTIQNVTLLKSRGHHQSFLGSLEGDQGDSSQYHVPKAVLLPRTLWLMLSHSLAYQERFHTLLVEGLSNNSSSASTSSVKHQAAEIIRKANTTGGSAKLMQLTNGQRFDHIDLIVLLLKEVYIRKMANAEGAITGIPSKLISLSSFTCDDPTPETESSIETAVDLYESICLVVLSRSLQRRILRPCAGRILHLLPRIPVSCIRLLELLLLTGTKPAASTPATSGRRNGQQIAAVDRGTRMTALDILGSLLFSSSCMNDPEVFLHVLCPLLWLSVDEDITTRTSAVNCLVGACKRIERDYKPGEGLFHVRTAILLFALQSALHCTGSMNIFTQIVKQRGGNQKRRQLHGVSSPESSIDDTSVGLMDFVIQCTLGSGMAKEENVASKHMDVEGDECRDDDIFIDIDEVLAAECFDEGSLFGGKFTPASEVVSDSGGNDNSNRKGFIERHFHLMSQLCMNKYSLLRVYFNIYEVTMSSPAVSRINEESNSDIQVSTVYLQYLRYQVEKEVLNIIPSLLPARRGFSRQKKSSSPVVAPIDIIKHLIDHCNVKTAVPLFCLVLEKVMDPISMPATEGLIELGRGLFKELVPAPNNICILLPLLGGMSTSEVVELLPQILLDLSSPSFVPLVTELDNSTAEELGEKEKNDHKNKFLRKAFHRITYTRPPPLSRAKLLVALHRIEPEEHSLKLKHILDAIGLCIAKKEEYSADVMKEAITLLLDDEKPAVALMRTVLLSAQTMPEIQKFTLHEVIPRLVRKKTWLIAPKVWEGVLMCVKTFNGQRDFEPTIRAFVGLPMTQLKSVITIAKDVKGILNRILRSMSTADIEECVSGRWAGIEDVNLTQAPKEQEEKKKFIESILQKKMIIALH